MVFRYGQTVNSTEVQQQNITWVQIGEALPPDHIPPGVTVAVHMGIELPQQNDPRACKQARYLCTSVWPIGRNNSERHIPTRRHRKITLSLSRKENSNTWRLSWGGHEQAYTSTTAFTSSSSRVEDSPASLEELGSRAHTVCGGEPNYIYPVQAQVLALSLQLGDILCPHSQSS